MCYGLDLLFSMNNTMYDIYTTTYKISKYRIKQLTYKTVKSQSLNDPRSGIPLY